MKKWNRGASTVIGLAAFTLVIGASPCRAQTWSMSLWDPYIDYSEAYNNGTYGRTADFTTNRVDGTSYTQYGGVRATVVGELTAWVNLIDAEDSVSASAYSYTLGGITWEWTGAPGTAPAVKLIHDSYTHGEVWAFGTASDEGIYPYPSLSVEAEGEGTARIVSDEDDTEAAGYATGWVDGAHSQSTAYAVLTGDNAYQPVYHSYVSGVNGHFDYDVEYWLSFEDYYQTDSGLSAIDGIAGVAGSAWCSGSASDIDNDTSVTGEGGIWHDATADIELDTI